jgi:hypothetical protein
LSTSRNADGDTFAVVSGSPEPPYGERVVSWRAIQQELGRGLDGGPEFEELAAETHRLRGLVMAQGAETDAVLGQILSTLDPSKAWDTRPAGQLLKDLRDRLPAELGPQWDAALNEISRAIKSRNRAVHADVIIGSTWVPHGTGGEEDVPVITLLGGDDYSAAELRGDLVLQQEATVLAVRLLLATQDHVAAR